MASSGTLLENERVDKERQELLQRCDQLEHAVAIHRKAFDNTDLTARSDSVQQADASSSGGVVRLGELCELGYIQFRGFRVKTADKELFPVCISLSEEGMAIFTQRGEKVATIAAKNDIQSDINEAGFSLAWQELNAQHKLQFEHRRSELLQGVIVEWMRRKAGGKPMQEVQKPLHRPTNSDVDRMFEESSPQSSTSAPIVE